MDADSSNPAFDPDRILEILDRHGVDYVLVGGVAARVHGTERATGVGDLIISIASLDDIIASKEYAGRRKDLDALPELQALRHEENGGRRP